MVIPVRQIIVKPPNNPFRPTDQNKIFANSVDPNETVHNEPSHQDLHCLPLCFDF